MFVYLSKLLPPLVYPLGLACLSLLVALFLARRAGLQRALMILALSCLWLGGNRWVSTALARSLEWRYIPPASIPNAEAIVLLGGGTLPADDPRPIVEINSAGDRVLYAAWLYKQGKADHILLSGGVLDWSPRHTTPAQDMAAILEMMGIPAQALWLESESRNTYENALFASRILQAKGVRRILLVTSASHMPRALKLFEAQGFTVIPLPTDYSVTWESWGELLGGDLRSQVINLLPSADNLVVTTRVLKEYIGMFVYQLRGWQ